MNEYDEEVLKVFLRDQGQLFDENVAETPEEAEEFLSDCMAEVVDSKEEVWDYLEKLGMDIYETEDLSDIAEVFPLPDGRYLIVEG
ncbi:MAG: glyoxalase [Lachnospiraceae bacterium]|nr:glyoxalase [Lachnospiraceae bacterium]